MILVILTQIERLRLSDSCLLLVILTQIERLRLSHRDCEPDCHTQRDRGCEMDLLAGSKSREIEAER